MNGPWASFWRCPPCGESVVVEVEPVLVRDGVITGATPPGTDLLVIQLPCAICGGPMQRVETPLERSAHT